MNDGYMQLDLAEESRKLTTFYLRFRENSAVEVRKIVSLEPNAITSMITSWYLVPHGKNIYPTTIAE